MSPDASRLQASRSQVVLAKLYVRQRKMAGYFHQIHLRASSLPLSKSKRDNASVLRVTLSLSTEADPAKLSFLIRNTAQLIAHWLMFENDTL